ncbi:TolC family protein [uncultured Desulfovibrio sp.]|uniref:TolC family protein n=1 Tax=uncultured Desulfovibrio sp. TaxID=167968 RepID=UPI00261D53AD|nr:TolC family protein [uncultured Desulfovibrio sp.]
MSTRRRFFLLLCLLPLLGCPGLPRPLFAAPEAGGTFSMERAVAQAMRANPGVEAKLLMLEQARMNVGVAQSYFWPRVSLVAGTSRVENYEDVQTYNSDNLTSSNWNRGLRASLSLFAGFAHLNNLQKSRIAAEVEKARHQQARLELGSNVQLQFLQLLKCREELKSAREAVARIETQLRAAEAFVRVGMAPYVNVLQNRTELSRARQQVIRVNNDIRNAEVQLNRYLGFPPDSPVNYAGSLGDFPGTVGYTEEEAVRTAERRRPDLIMARKSVEAARRDMNVVMGQYLPRVDATYDSMSSSKDYDNRRYEGYTRNYWTAGLNFSWEIFSGGGTTFSALAERKRVQALQRDYEDAVSGARADVIRALLDITAARELIAASRKGVDAARESYGMASKRYMTNTGTVTELLDAQLRLTQAENDASRALAEYHSARARFFCHIGLENPGLR